MAREYFCAYHSYLKSIEPLGDAARGRLFTALLQYSATGEEPELRGAERILFPTMREQIDRDANKYAKLCETNRANGALGAAGGVRGANAPQGEGEGEGKEEDKGEEESKGKDKEEGKDKDDGKGKGDLGIRAPERRLFPPSVQDVKDYCKERGNGVDPEHFYDFYSAKGWRIGSAPMRDWQASVRTWERHPGCSPEEVAKREEEHRRAQERAADQLQKLYEKVKGQAQETDLERAQRVYEKITRHRQEGQ